MIILSSEIKRNLQLEILWPLLLDPIINIFLLGLQKNFVNIAVPSTELNPIKHKFLCILYLSWDTIVYIFCGVVFYAYIKSPPISGYLSSIDFEIFLAFYIICKNIEQWSYLIFDQNNIVVQQKTKTLSLR
jgi:hypothetical protein